jgi:hypothetical protein
MSNRAWLHLALEGRLKLRRSGLASRSTHVVIPHPSSEHQSSSILSTCSRRLPRLENIWECLVGHISKLSKHVGFLRTKQEQNRGCKMLAPNLCRSRFRLTKTCKIPSAPRITRLKDSWLHMISDMSRHRGMPWNPWHLINRIHINSLSSLGREDLGCANATIQRNSWRTMAVWVEYRWRYLFISKL